MGSGTVIPHGIYDVGRNRGFVHLNTSHDTSELACDSIAIRIAHDPPYCSKYNPIEHRLFSHVTRACRGVIFRTRETVQYDMSKTETASGLEVTVRILEKVHQTGLRCAAGFKKAMTIVFDKALPKWNYRALPEPA